MQRLVVILILALGACSSASGPDRHANVIHNLFASTAQIVVERDGGGRNTGSGVILQVEPESGRVLVLTAKHVVEPLGGLRVYVVGPRRRTRLDAKVVAVSDKYDLALIETTGLPAAKAHLKPQATLGDDIWVVAFPWGERRTVVTGIVSQIDWNDEADGPARTIVPISGPVTLVDAASSFGASGGGVFDARSGRLLGIVRGYRTVTFSLPGDRAEPIRFPVGGETTVVPATHILEFVRETERGRPKPSGPPRVTANASARR